MSISRTAGAQRAPPALQSAGGRWGFPSVPVLRTASSPAQPGTGHGVPSTGHRAGPGMRRDRPGRAAESGDDACGGPALLDAPGRTFGARLPDLRARLGGTPISGSPWELPGERCPSPCGSVLPVHRSLCHAKRSGIGMKFCHGDKHCNLQHHPQICLPHSPAPVIALADALSLLFNLVFSKTHISWIHTIPAPVRTYSPFSHRKYLFSVCFMEHRHTCALPGLDLSASICVFTLHFLLPRISPCLKATQLSSQILAPSVFLLQHFLWEAGSNILC